MDIPPEVRGQLPDAPGWLGLVWAGLKQHFPAIAGSVTTAWVFLRKKEFAERTLLTVLGYFPAVYLGPSIARWAGWDETGTVYLTGCFSLLVLGTIFDIVIHFDRSRATKALEDLFEDFLKSVRNFRGK